MAQEAGCPLIGGHSIDDPEPKYGMAVTGVTDPDRLLRNDAATPGLPLTLTKPIGVGLLNNWHTQTGEVFEDAVATMIRLNRDAAEATVAAGVRAATDVTGSDCSATVQDVPSHRGRRGDRPERGARR